MPKRWMWDLLLLVSGVVYVAMVLYDTVESLPFVVVFVALAAHELISAHRVKG